MSEVKSDVLIHKDNLGKNLYSQTKYYTLKIEQHVLADNKDEAEDMFIENGGIDHSKITNDIAEAKNGVETTIVDADYDESMIQLILEKLLMIRMIISQRKTVMLLSILTLTKMNIKVMLTKMRYNQLKSHLTIM